MTLRIKHGFLLSAAFVFALFAGTAGAEEADEEAASEEEDVE